jgi:hypothetical protein
VVVLEIFLRKIDCVDDLLGVIEVCGVSRVHRLAFKNPNQTVLRSVIVLPQREMEKAFLR